jgi:hypothetical protein
MAAIPISGKVDLQSRRLNIRHDAAQSRRNRAPEPMIGNKNQPG